VIDSPPVVKPVARCGRSARELFGALLASIFVIVACGGESRSTQNHDGSPNGGSSGASGDGGDERDIPRLDGVPIGDCREPSDAERTTLGCPAAPPQEGASCNLARGVTCAYSLSTNQGSAYQDLYMCSNDVNRQWWSLQERCGELCTDGGPHVVELDVTDCTSRPADTCELEGAVFAYAPSANTLLSFTLGNVIDDCAPGTVNFSATLELERGCPTRFSTNYAFSPEALACIQAQLGRARYACGERLPCAETSKYLL